MDQPNRAVRTRMLRGVGGGSCETSPYPDGPKYFSIAKYFFERIHLNQQALLFL
jgi:hypothetical protein